MEPTPDNQSSELNEAAPLKKSWIKPETKVLDVDNTMAGEGLDAGLFES